MIELNEVSKAYGDDTAIGPVSLQIPAGGITALVGPNGAGKSTLLTMIGRLLAIPAPCASGRWMCPPRTRKTWPK